MKKIFIIILLSAVCTCLTAGPADPSRQAYTQPDGSVVTLYLHGDEHLNWMTDENGAVFQIGEDGFVRPGQKPSAYSPALRNAPRRSGSVGNSKGLKGNHKFCVILVQFNDVKFIKSKEQISKMFNGTGAESGSTGSVREYWEDQSDGQFFPSFDIYGPYTMDSDISYYVNNGWEPESILINAIKYHGGDEDIDFSEYTGNGSVSSHVESVIMIFAGNSAASGAVSLWPCQSSLAYNFDGVELSSFCCGPERQGKDSENLAGIGHICHEMGHCFGMPDLYDTDRSNHAHSANPCSQYSLMDNGCYINYSKTPPPLSMTEKYLCGWVSNLTSGENGEIETVSASGSKTLYEIGRSGSNPRALRINTDKSGEFFMCEFRSVNPSVNKWGAGLPKPGMVVFHVDRSGTWGSNINGDYLHPKYYLVNASDPGTIQLYENRESTDWTSFPFPGSKNIVSFNPSSWSGTDAYVSLTGMPAIGVSSSNTSISPKAYVRTFPLINNPGKGVYSPGDSFSLSLSPGYSGTENVTKWYFDGTETSGSSVTLTEGSHTVEAVLASGKRLRLDLLVK